MTFVQDDGGATGQWSGLEQSGEAYGSFRLDPIKMDHFG